MRLRQLTLADADVLADWAEDAEFCREAGWTVGLPRERRWAFWRELIQSPPVDLLRLGVVHGGDLVGYVDLHGLEPSRRELGYLVGGRSRWGRGLGTQAASAALDYGFGTLRLSEIWAEALDANRRSVRVLERLGMREVGRGAEGEFLGEPTFFRQFVLSDSEWR